jgi:hypothetical protein
MQIDLQRKAQELLEMLANSIHDRDPKASHPFFFSIAEIQTAELWLAKFIHELKYD